MAGTSPAMTEGSGSGACRHGNDGFPNQDAPCPSWPGLSRPSTSSFTSAWVRVGPRAFGSVPQTAFILGITPASRTIIPVRIHRQDQPHLPCARPVFHVLLSLDRVNDAVEALIIDEPVQPIPPRETGQQILAVLPNASGEIARHPDIKDTVRSVGHDVHETIPSHSSLSRVALGRSPERKKTWMAGTSPAMTERVVANGEHRRRYSTPIAQRPRKAPPPPSWPGLSPLSGTVRASCGGPIDGGCASRSTTVSGSGGECAEVKCALMLVGR